MKQRDLSLYPRRPEQIHSISQKQAFAKIFRNVMRYDGDIQKGFFLNIYFSVYLDNRIEKFH